MKSSGTLAAFWFTGGHSVGPGDYRCVHDRCLYAVRDVVRGLNLKGVPRLSIQVMKVPDVSRLYGSGRRYAWPAVVIHPIGAETMDPAAGNNRRDDVGYPCNVSIFEKDNQKLQANLGRHLEWREKICRGLRHQDLPRVPEVIRVTIEPGPIGPYELWKTGLFATTILARCLSREPRGRE